MSEKIMFGSFSKPKRIDWYLQAYFGADAKQMAVHTTLIPGFRFVDFFNAIADRATRLDAEYLASAHMYALPQLFQTNTMQMHGVEINASPRRSWQTAVDNEVSIADDSFWLINNRQNSLVFRLSFNEMRSAGSVEIASTSAEEARAETELLKETADLNSIWRGAIVKLGFEAGTRDEYGDVERPEGLRVAFSEVAPVSEAEIILGDEHRRLLQRNVIDLVQRKAFLEAHGISTRRGVLLHGPPGTGKTFACRHICQQLPETTRIFLTGKALEQVGAVFELARKMCPSIIFIEDADLMFANREVNLYSSSLGELMDQLDGIRSNEEVSVVMSTNAIDRMEAALKDRPGRISQCIFMGAPDEALRERMITMTLKNIDQDDLDMNLLVQLSEGTTQAFIREWIFRALQIATERLAAPTDPLLVRNSDFEEAKREMEIGSSDSAGRIVGFRL